MCLRVEERCRRKRLCSHEMENPVNNDGTRGGGWSGLAGGQVPKSWRMRNQNWSGVDKNDPWSLDETMTWSCGAGCATETFGAIPSASRIISRI